MTTSEVPGFTRTRIDRSSSPVPLAFVFDSNPHLPEHTVTTVGWTAGALQVLRDLHNRFAALVPRQSLPVRALRGRLEVGDPDNLRIARDLGLWSFSPTILWTSRECEDASRQVSVAALGWLTDDVPLNDAQVRALAQHLRQLARQGELVNATRRTARVFNWAQTRSGTTVIAATNRDGYADLADFFARRLEGEEILPGLGGLRRIASGRLDSNQAELLTDPAANQATPFSLVVRVKVLSFPGRSTTVVVLEVSRRNWSRAFKKAAVRELSAYALPDGTRSALRFTLRRHPVTSESRTTYAYQPDADFAPIARAYNLPFDLTGGQIAAMGHNLPGCRLLVVYKYGVSERAGAKQGVPDLDKMEAFRRIGALLAPSGLRPWQSLSEIPSATRAVKDRNQKWRDRDADEDHREAFEQWQAEAKADIAACYAAAHHLIIAYHPVCHSDAERARDLLNSLLESQVRIQFVPMPRDVHGPRSTLPKPTVKKPQNRDYAELRMKAWMPFVSEVQRYQNDVGMPIDGILVIAPEWYEGGSQHDDRVNKRASRIALARELRIPIQYLRPEQEEGQTFRRNQDPANLFETRVMMAWLDLAWKTIGRIKSDKLGMVMQRIYGAARADGATSVLPPDRALAVGILRRNETRLANGRSFVPFAIELDMEHGICSARFARERGPGFEITPLQPLATTLVELATSGPISLATEKTTRKEQRQERSQHFFHQAITDFCQRS
ncbi:MAG: pPIWI_RE module domain-containing protein, partial [Ktedonobacterales bacterium]